MNKHRSLVAVLTTSLLGALWLATPQLARADWFGLTDIGFSIFQYGAYFISYLISIIGYLVFTIEVFFLQFMLDLNFTIVNSLSVQFGFSIVLAFANILFVAAVIIMAVATIIRYDTYGAKQLLWKIVIAAIGVNFSLILAGTVINFADQATKFFMNNSVPNQSADTGVSGFGDDGFVSNLAGAFNPQRMMIASGISTSSDTVSAVKAGAINGVSQMGGIYAAIAGVFMTAMMVVLLAIFFGVLVAAFFVRFIMLSLLLTIMPAVWLAWIFPFGKGLVSWWRDKFVKFTFFAPMAMFFLYLSMKSVSFLNSAHIVGNKGIQGLGKQVGQGGEGVTNFLTQAFGALAKPLIENALNFALVAGTLYGGLYFSSKLGIKAAGAGAKAFESIGNSVKRRVTTRAKDTGLGAWDRFRSSGKDAKGESRMQRVGARINSLANNNSKIAKYTGANAIMKVTGVKAGVEAIGTTIAKAGLADNKEEKEKRAERTKDRDKGLTGAQVDKNFKRGLSGSLNYANLEEQRGEFMNLVDKKMASSLHEHAYVKDENGKIVTDSEGRDVVDKVKAEELKKFMRHATQAGYADTVLKANPLMARFSPPTKVDKRDKEGRLVLGKDGKPEKRYNTQEEAVFGAIKASKAEDVADLVTKNLNAFGSADGSPPTREQIKAVQALGGRVSKIDDPEALTRIHNTVNWAFEHKEEKDNAILYGDIIEGGKDEFSTGGLAFGERDYELFKPLLKQLDKNTTLAPILADAIKKKGTTKGGGDDDDDDAGDTGGGTTADTGREESRKPAESPAEASRRRRRERKESLAAMKPSSRRSGGPRVHPRI